LTDSPEKLPEWIDLSLFMLHELTTLRTCVNRHQPFEPEDWHRGGTGVGIDVAKAWTAFEGIRKVACPVFISRLAAATLFVLCSAATETGVVSSWMRRS